MSSEMMKREEENKEINEAVMAGERALSSLLAAKEKLDTARSWGLADLFGGGAIVDMIKHSRLKEAEALMEDARGNLMIFQRELRDVHLPVEFRVDISSFLSFADFFLDGIVADYLVHTKIAEAREQVDDAAERVRAILNQLSGLKDTQQRR